MGEELISICIPAYKNRAFLSRLLDSVALQTYKNFEVIITDDSPDDSVEDFVRNYAKLQGIKYFRNDAALGTPENWNAAIRQARGSWIKLMHDDDWFAGPDSLQMFVDIARREPKAAFIYSAYNNVEHGKMVSRSGRPSTFRNYMFKKCSESIISENFIGPPSAVMHRNISVFYDNRLKWLVDVDFYARFLKGRQALYCEQPLVNIGISEVQVTKESSRVASVEIPEHSYILQKAGSGILKNILVYDTFWRLIRNFSIRDPATFPAHSELAKMIRLQKKLPARWLDNGFFSKSFMFFRYLQFSLSSKKR